MCISVNESAASNTQVYVGEGKWKDTDVHVLAYQCMVDSHDPSGKGAMILPIPSIHPLTEENFIDTSGCVEFLKNISDASKRHDNYQSMSRSFSLGEDALIVERGSTTYVSAQNFMAAAQAMIRVPFERRPDFSAEFISGCAALYTDPIVIACWAGSIQTEPLLLWYVPSNPKVFRIPSMDAHNGKAPDISAKVDVDAIYSVSAGPGIGHQVNYDRGRFPIGLQSLLPQRVHGTNMQGYFPNGDMFVDVEESRQRQHPIIQRSVSLHTIPSVKRSMSGWTE